MPAAPPPDFPAPARLEGAYRARADTDYLFGFWSAVGWSVLTFGVFFLYVIYQMVRRMREHNLRRLALLDAARAMAWEEAGKQRLEAELRPSFERMAGHLENMRQMSTDFRDPWIWVIIAVFFRGITDIIVYILNDMDLVRHGAADFGAEAELTAICGRMGLALPPPDPALTKARHNDVGRVVATIFSFGIYGFWWTADNMREGNQHFEAGWAWEDALVAGTLGGPVAATDAGPAPTAT